MRTGFTPTETAQTIGTRTFLNGQSSQFKIMPNVIQQWEVAGVTRVFNMEFVKNPQVQQ